MKLKIVALVIICGSNAYAMLNAPCSSSHDPHTHAKTFYVCKAMKPQGQPCFTVLEDSTILRKHLKDNHKRERLTAEHVERLSYLILAENYASAELQVHPVNKKFKKKSRSPLRAKL